MLLAAGLMTMMSLVACSFGKTTDHPVEGEFIVIWDRGAGPSFDQHFTDHLTAKFPNATFEETFVIREFRYLGAAGMCGIPLMCTTLQRKICPGTSSCLKARWLPICSSPGILSRWMIISIRISASSTEWTAGRWNLPGSRETARSTAFPSAKMCMPSTITPRYSMNWAFLIRRTG